MDTGNWLTGHEVLISPQSFLRIDPDAKEILLNLTMEQIENSPELEAHQPITRQDEASLHDYYGWPYYWTGDWMSSAEVPVLPTMAIPITGETGVDQRADLSLDDELHLHSVREVTGYEVDARDDKVGRVDDFLIGNDDWRILYMVADTGGLFSRKHVLVSPSMIVDVDWQENIVDVDLDKATIENSPAFDYETGLSETYRQDLDSFYHRRP